MIKSQAKQLATTALTLSIKAGYELGEANARSHQGAIQLTQDNNAKAIEACLEALKIFDKKEQYRNTKRTIFQTNLKLNLALNGAKFNSHFVHHVLNAIQQVVHLQKPQEAQEYLIKLSRLLQYVLKKSPLDMFRCQRK